MRTQQLMESSLRSVASKGKAKGMGTDCEINRSKAPPTIFRLWFPSCLPSFAPLPGLSSGSFPDFTEDEDSSSLPTKSASSSSSATGGDVGATVGGDVGAAVGGVVAGERCGSPGFDIVNT
jgi:hypothetical protein